jgi:hypothetical protein
VEVTQWNEPLGTLAEITPNNEDAAYVRLYDDRSLQWTVAKNSDDQYEEGWWQYGAYSYDQLEDLQAEGESLTLQGRVTGRESGGIRRLRPDENGVIIDVDSSGGDSGGIYYNVEPNSDTADDLWVAGLHSGSWGDDGQYAGGVRPVWIENNLGEEF